MTMTMTRSKEQTADEARRDARWWNFVCDDLRDTESVTEAEWLEWLEEGEDETEAQGDRA